MGPAREDAPVEEEQVRPDRGRQAVQAEGLCGEPQLLRAHLLRQVLPGERAQPGGQHVQVQAEKDPDHERGPHLHGALPGQRHHHPVQGRRLHGRGGEQGVGQERAGQARHQDAPDRQRAGHPDGARGRQGAQQAGPPVPAAPGDVLRGRPAAAQGVRVDLPARAEAQGGDAALPRGARVQAGEGEGHGAAALSDVGRGAGRVQAAEAARRRAAPAAAAGRGAHRAAGAAAEAAERTVLLQTPRGAQPQRAQAGLHHRGPAGGGGGGAVRALRVRGRPPGRGLRGRRARAEPDHQRPGGDEHRERRADSEGGPAGHQATVRGEHGQRVLHREQPGDPPAQHRAGGGGGGGVARDSACTSFVLF